MSFYRLTVLNDQFFSKPFDTKPRVSKQTIQPQKLEFNVSQQTEKDILEASAHIDE